MSRDFRADPERFLSPPKRQGSGRYAAMVDGRSARLRAQLRPDTQVIATGRLASTLIPFCESIDEVDDQLTLDGLRLIWERRP